MRLCFDTELLWYFSAFNCLLSNVCGALAHHFFVLRKGKHKAKEFFGGKGELCDYHVPQSVSRDQMRPNMRI